MSEENSKNNMDDMLLKQDDDIIEYPMDFEVDKRSSNNNRMLDLNIPYDKYTFPENNNYIINENNKIISYITIIDDVEIDVNINIKNEVIIKYEKINLNNMIFNFNDLL